jgi:DNA repair exonuclease SbcCD ATPase subunit
MKLDFLRIDYFMSFGAGNIIDLADKGLCLINGINEASGAASSNGAGKSALQEALLWALYGQTTKGVAAGDVVNNQHKKNCEVTVGLIDGDWHYHICRFRAHDKYGDSLLFSRNMGEGTEAEDLCGVDKAATQARIDQLLGCGFTLFCNSAYFSQGNVKPFCTFTDKQIKEVLIEALDMGRFTAGQERIRIDLRILCEERAKFVGQCSRLEEEIAEATERRATYQSSHEKFDASLEVARTLSVLNIRALNAEIEDLKKKLKVKDTLLEHIDAHRELVSKIPAADTERGLVKEASDRFLKVYRELSFSVENLNRSAEAGKTALLAAHTRVGTNCKECGKLIAKEDMAGVIAGINTDIATILAELDRKGALLAKADPKLVEYKDKADEINARIETYRAAEADMHKLQIALADIEGCEKQIERAKKEIETLERAQALKAAEKSPWEGYVVKESKTITAAQEKIGVLRAALNEKDAEIKYLEYWERAFGYSGIPSFLLDAVTPFLNERANHYSGVVSGGEIEINFSTVTKTKKGDLKDKFCIEITHKTGAKTYRGTSGGERKRADICIAQSIQDLVRSYGRNTIAYCSYDEPFEDLDGEGVSYLVEMLNEVAEKVGTTLVVTHNNDFKAMFSNTITVVKGADGFSKIVE